MNRVELLRDLYVWAYERYIHSLIKPFTALLAFWLLCTLQVAHAQVFESQDDGVRHIESGWVFPDTIGNLERLGPPLIVAGGTLDVGANYVQRIDGIPINATIYVYRAATEAADGTYEGFKEAIESQLKSTLAQTWAEGPFRVEGMPLLWGRKVVYKVGFGVATALTNLYYFDLGTWIVKIRVSAARANPQTLLQADDFVRSQQWSRLALPAEHCDFTACRPPGGTVHSGARELAAIALVEKRITQLFPPTKLACSPATFAAVLDAVSPESQVTEPQAALLASCAPAPTMQIGLIRISYPPKMLEVEFASDPDGLSLQGPLTFLVYRGRSESYFTQLHDGRLSERDLADMLAAAADRAADFAIADRNGRHARQVVRFVE